ncbi:MAG: tetratricopeptide repeat protein [Alphaproteobacteria bacterium]|nr:tetratricopeptide repeat protein [Alphaproteobacteria bacterium]
MKKTPVKKTSNSKKSVKVRPVASKPTVKTVTKKTCVSPWSLSIYVYWFVILFFIAATFYILGRTHNAQPEVANVEITEEILLQAGDYYESGKTKLLAGNVDEALADLTAAIDAGAASVDTYVLRGEAFMQAGNYRDALADFNTALSKDPSSAVAYYDRSLLHARLEDYAAALNDINNALAANVSNPSSALQMRDLYAKRGQINLWTKNWEGAVADYTNSLARPEGIVSPEVYAERAEAYTAMGNYDDAVKDYASAIRVISEQIQGLPTKAERESLSSRAMNYFEKSAALNLQQGLTEAARTDLESAYTIAIALKDSESISRLKALITELVSPTLPAEAVTEEATAETVVQESVTQPAEAPAPVQPDVAGTDAPTEPVAQN